MRVVVDQRDFLRDLIVEFLREVEIRALRGVDHPLQRSALLFVEIDVEMRGVVDAPLELVIDDLVLPERVSRRGEHKQRGENDESLQVASRWGLAVTAGNRPVIR